MRRIFLMFLFLLGLASCHPNTSEGRVRVQALVDKTELNLTVVLEGDRGQSLSGALVQVKDPAGALHLMSYDSRTSAFEHRSQAIHGVYEVIVDSVVLSRRIQNLPVTILAPQPDILSVSDGLGHRAEDFEKLEVSSPIHVEWQATEGAGHYLLELSQTNTPLLSITTTNTHYTIPANTLSATQTGSYASLQVTANHQIGDVNFSDNIFVVATSTGSNYSFQVIP